MSVEQTLVLFIAVPRQNSIFLLTIHQEYLDRDNMSKTKNDDNDDGRKQWTDKELKEKKF
jgi:hypothetical protein